MVDMEPLHELNIKIFLRFNPVVGIIEFKGVPLPVNLSFKCSK